MYAIRSYYVELGREDGQRVPRVRGAVDQPVQALPPQEAVGRTAVATLDPETQKLVDQRVQAALHHESIYLYRLMVAARHT